MQGHNMRGTLACRASDYLLVAANNQSGAVMRER